MMKIGMFCRMLKINKIGNLCLCNGYSLKKGKNFSIRAAANALTLLVGLAIRSLMVSANGPPMDPAEFRSRDT